MSKTRRNYNEEYFDNEEYGMDIDDYREHKKQKRLQRALKTMDVNALIDLEEDEY